MTITEAEKKERREYPRSSHTLSKRSGNLRGFSSWNHRCYVIQPRKLGGTGAWKATNVLPGVAADIPLSFIWTARKDREGLCEYIDALLTGRRSKSVAAEKSGLVESIEMFPAQNSDQVQVRVKIQRFVDCMALRDAFDVPLWGRVHFITDGKNVIPTEYLGALSQMFDPATKKFYDVAREWWHCRESDLERMGLRPEDITSGMYRDRYQNTGVEAGSVASDDGGLMPGETISEDGDPETASTIPTTARSAPSIPVREIEISRRPFPKHAELLTLVQPLQGRPYYTRRLLLFSGVLLWSGTSFYPDGPWTVWERNNALLISLGISE